MSRGTTSRLIAVLGLIALAPAARAQARPPRQPPRAQPQPAPGPADTATFAQLKYRYIGPVGNRVAAVAGVASDPSVYYAGAASGGIWKTTDGGVHWQPIFDDQPVQSIGALAVAPSDPNVVWAGTGEAWIRSHISIGNGIYKSTDAGKTWHHAGLDNTGRIARVVVHPGNPDVVYVAALGHSYGPQQERGVYRTTDGGKSWERVLFVDENTGASDIVMDPTNPRILFAGMWQLEIHTWGRESGGLGSGIYTSRDGGTTWKKPTGHGLPAKPFGKVGLAIAPGNASRIYALIETGDGVPWHGQATDNGELWRSDDGGEAWKVVSYDRQLSCRQPYYTRMAVAPDRENEAYFLCASFSKTLDGGATTVDVPFAQSPGGDNHDMWIDPTNGNRMIVGNDGQVSISTNRGRTWYRQQLPIAQMYHATVDNQIPYYVMGNRQDGPSSRGPSNSRIGGFGGGVGVIPRGEWHSVAGGESGWATPDPTDPNIIWSSASGSGSVGGIVARYDERTRQALYAEVWPQSTLGSPAADVKYRFIWTAPLTISPHDHNKVYVGSQFVHVTTDGGKSWQVISPDLTLNDKAKQQISGGLTPDNIGVEYADVVFAIAESPLKPGLIWAGTNDGLVQVTRDGGKSWSNVTTGIPGMPSWGTVSNIEPSRYDTATAYITVDAHQANNRDPFVYKTTDYGRSWKPIVSGLPRSPMGYAHVVREDPVRRGLLYLGTESALYASFDDGESWQPLQTTLPHAPVYWLVLQEHFNDLVVSTYGRGFWILDDVTPLEQLTADVRSQAAHLFKPRPAYRFRQITAPMAMTDDPTAGQNPPYGAAINYWLTPTPTGGGGGWEVTLTILDAAGQTVRTLQGTQSAGINRVWWDLRSDSTKAARLRTAPLYDPELRLGSEGWRAAPGVGRMTVLVPPGTYTVKLKVHGQELSQPLVVRKDPNSGGSEAEIQSQAKLLAALQGDLNGAVDMINRIEVVRSQLQNLRSLLPADLRTRADSLEQKFTGIENTLVDLRLTGRGQDDVRWPTMLAGQLAYLAQGIASSDFAPTVQQTEVAQVLAGQLKTVGTQLDGLLSQDLAQFNASLKQQNVGNVVPGTP